MYSLRREKTVEEEERETERESEREREREREKERERAYSSMLPHPHPSPRCLVVHPAVFLRRTRVAGQDDICNEYQKM